MNNIFGQIKKKTRKQSLIHPLNCSSDDDDSNDDSNDDNADGVAGVKKSASSSQASSSGLTVNIVLRMRNPKKELNDIR
jgi:hypothetical protein